MKLKGLLWGACACAVLAGCSNDDVAVDNGNNVLTNGGKAYVKVRIAMGDGAGSRATAGDYDYGTKEDHAIKSIFFGFYDADGKWVTSGDVPNEYSEDITTTPNEDEPVDNIDAFAETVIALEVAEGDPLPTQVIAYVNMSDLKTEISGANTITAAKALTAKTASNADVADETNGFMMTNSTYLDASGAEQLAVAIPASKFFESSDQALDDTDPITIHVERLAAKVTVTGTPSIENPGNIPGYALTFTPKGYVVSGKNTEEYLLKNVQTDWKDWNWFNAASDYRCFWAEDPNYDEADGAATLNYATYADAENNPINTPQYCMENTFDLTTGEIPGYNECTHVLLIGNYGVKNTTTNKDVVLTGQSLYMLAGHAYVGDEIIEELLGRLTDAEENAQLPWYQEENTWKHPDASNYEIVRVEGSQNTVTLAFVPTENVTYYTGTNHDTELTTEGLEAYNEGLAEFLTTNEGAPEAFYEGAAYFAVPIEHFGGTQDDNDTGRYGVVRNHSYVLTVSQVSGLGEGIYNPGEEIIPNPGKKRYYVAATLRVLSWKTVSQDVNFGE